MIYTDIPNAGLSLDRCPSPASTAAGGLTPLTDISSPIVRGDSYSHGMPCSTEKLSPITLLPAPAPCVISTNCVRIARRLGYRLYEYRADGSIDLVSLLFERISPALGSLRILMLPIADNKDLTCLLVCSSNETPRRPFFSGCGISLTFVREHDNFCVCVQCDRLTDYLLAATKDPRVGPGQFISNLVLPPPDIPTLAVPGRSVRICRELALGPTVATDLVVKWLAPPSQRPTMFERLFSAGTVVFTIYNNQVYTVKRVVRSRCPESRFFNKKTNQLVSYSKHVADNYPGFVARARTPYMLEVYAEKRSETCLLIPEFCLPVRGPFSVSVEVPMQTVHSQTRIEPVDRFRCIRAAQADLTVRWPECVETVPVELFGQLVENGGRKKYFVNSAINTPSWVVVCEGGVGLAELARFVTGLVRASNGRLPEPVVVPAIPEKALEKLPPLSVVLIILKTRNKYPLLKHACTVRLGLVSQVVRSESVARSNSEILRSVAEDLLLKLVQIPLYSVPVQSRNRLLVGLDFHRFGDVFVYAISVCVCEENFSPISSYYTRVAVFKAEPLTAASVYMQLILKHAGPLLTVCSGLMLVFASRRRNLDWPNLDALQIELSSLLSQKSLLFLNCSTKSQVRLFQAGRNCDQNMFVPTAYRRVDSGESLDAFYLIPHSVAKGNALPTHFIVLSRMGGYSLGVDQIAASLLTLCERGTRIPNLFRHTRRMAEFVGVHLKRGGRMSVDELIEMTNESENWRRLADRPFYL